MNILSFYPLLLIPHMLHSMWSMWGINRLWLVWRIYCNRQQKTAQNLNVEVEQLKLSPHFVLLRCYLCTNKTILYVLYWIVNGDKLESAWLIYDTLYTHSYFCFKHKRKGCHKNAKQDRLHSCYLKPWLQFNNSFCVNVVILLLHLKI